MIVAVTGRTEEDEAVVLEDFAEDEEVVLGALVEDAVVRVAVLRSGRLVAIVMDIRYVMFGVEQRVCEGVSSRRRSRSFVFVGQVSKPSLINKFQ